MPVSEKHGMRLRSNMEIRKAEKRHIKGIAELERVSFSSPWSESAIDETMSRDETLFLVALEGDEVIGYIGSYYCLTDGYITNVAVSPASRRNGVGRALVSRLIEEGKFLSLDFWTLEVRESNAPAQALYSSLGFTEVGRRPRFYSNPEETALLLTYYMDASGN